MDELNEIESVDLWDSGGAMELDIVRLKDGSILAISEEVIVLYSSEEDLMAGEVADRPSIIRP